MELPRAGKLRAENEIEQSNQARIYGEISARVESVSRRISEGRDWDNAADPVGKPVEICTPLCALGRQDPAVACLAVTRCNGCVLGTYAAPKKSLMSGV